MSQAASRCRTPLVRWDITRLRGLFAPSFVIEYRLARLDWFGSRVLCIRLEPEGRSRHMTEAVAAAFPGAPYRNAFTSMIPQITVGEEAAAWRMRRRPGASPPAPAVRKWPPTSRSSRPTDRAGRW